MEAETQVTSDVSDAIGGAGDATTVVGDPTSEASDATSEAGDATSEAAGDATIVERIAQSGQERLQRLSNDLIANPVVSAAMSRAMAAKARADAVGTMALAQLNLPTADDVAAIRSRLRTVASRSERMESTLKDLLERLDRIEAKLDAHIGADVPDPARPPRAPRTTPPPGP